MIKAYWVDEPDDNFAAVVIVDEDSGDTFEVQRAYEFDDQDHALGMDTYCLVRGGATHYGGIRSYEVSDVAVKMFLSQSAAAALELPEEVEFPLAEPCMDVVRMRLPWLLG